MEGSKVHSLETKINLLALVDLIVKRFWAVVLGLIHAAATGQFIVAKHGICYGFGSRDELKLLTGIGAQIQRAFANYMQTSPFLSGRFDGACLWATSLADDDRHAVALLADTSSTFDATSGTTCVA